MGNKITQLDSSAFEEIYNKYDKKRIGYLSHTELFKLCKELSIKFDSKEKKEVLIEIDPQSTNKIEKEEIKKYIVQNTPISLSNSMMSIKMDKSTENQPKKEQEKQEKIEIKKEVFIKDHSYLEKLTKTKISDNLLRHEFNILSKNEQTMSTKTLVEFLDHFCDVLSIEKNKKFRYEKEDSLKSYFSRGFNETKEVYIPKLVICEIFQEKNDTPIGELAELNFEDYKDREITFGKFRRSFLFLLSLLSFIDPNFSYYKYDFTDEIKITLMTLVKSDLFERERSNRKLGRSKNTFPSLSIKTENETPKENYFEHIKTSSQDECDLPTNDTNRKTLLNLVFRYLDSTLLLKASMVNKEWFIVSRKDNYWKSFLNDLYPIEEEKIVVVPLMPPSLEQMRRGNRVTSKEKIKSYLRNNKPRYTPPIFLEYWKLRGVLSKMESEDLKPQPPMMCGIGAIPRIGSLNEKGEVVTELKGCCHDSVCEIADKLIDIPSFKELFPNTGDQNFEDLKKKWTEKVSLECMENKMDIEEIRDRLVELIKTNQI